nr:hypothetical protein [Tanacetum cinerariifolium]
MDEALVPSPQRLRIGRSNFRLPLDIQSKESTLQLVYDVLYGCSFFKAFLVTADVPEIYMQEIWATTYVYQHSIQFKMNNKKHIQLAMNEAFVPTAQRLKIGRSNFRLLSDIKSKESTLQLVYDVLRRCPFFKAFLVTVDVDILNISLRVHGHPFVEPPFKEEILAIIRFLGHSVAIRTLTDVNINKLYQSWRSFDALINKCLTGKSSGYDSFRLSQAQILWGLYHKKNVDYAYLMWEDFVYQVEHKNQKKSNEMYYP